MKAIEYQEPKLLILLLANEDVVTTSDWVEEDAKLFDKGVEDFF